MTAVRFSLVCATGDPGADTTAFLQSVAGLDLDVDRFEVILVDHSDAGVHVDGWTSWAAAYRGQVRVLRSDGASPGTALDLGKDAARGEWVTFPSPVDVLGRAYLNAVDDFLVEHPTAALVAANQQIWDPVTDEITRTHPLRTFYTDESLVDLVASEEHFCESALAAFFPAAGVADLAFDRNLGVTFVGGHFLARYLLGLPRPEVGFLRTARYRRRRPPPGEGGRESSFRSVPDHRVLFERGYLDLLDRARARADGPPGWLQRQLVFELGRFLDSVGRATSSDLTAGDSVEEFHSRIRALVTGLRPAAALRTAPYYLSRPTRLALEHGYAGGSGTDDRVLLDAYDERSGLVRARYLFTGTPPVEVLSHGDRPVAPEHHKVREVDLLDQPVLRERILWLRPDPDLRVRLDGTDVKVLDRLPAPEEAPAEQVGTGWRERREFRNAWVVMDKIHVGRDNGEHLFTYLRSHHRRVNAFFVVEEGTPCWDRLRARYGRRVVAHGSPRWLALMAHCVEYISSHCDAAITDPPALRGVVVPAWRFSLIDHGVRKDDGSAWLNNRPLDLIVASTHDEFASLAGDGTKYVFTTKEVVLTGMPRLDRLRSLGQQVAPSDRRLLLVAPTWRNWLVPPLVPGSQRRELEADALRSEFVASWTALLVDPRLAALCAEHGLDLTLLPHPNLEAMLPHLELPDHVRTVTYADADVQELFAASRVLVTDYSSVAFDLAYIDRPVVYFQFDVDRFRSGEHTLRPGYFRQELHGFGPTADTVDEAVAAIGATVRSGPAPEPLYAARSAAAFGDRDGNCCARTVAAIRSGTG